MRRGCEVERDQVYLRSLIGKIIFEVPRFRLGCLNVDYCGLGHLRNILCPSLPVTQTGVLQ
jgi:hypothetical protein